MFNIVQRVKDEMALRAFMRRTKGVPVREFDPDAPPEPPLSALEGMEWILPPAEVFTAPESDYGRSAAQENMLTRKMQKALDDFGIKGKVTRASVGPVIVRYEVIPAPGVRMRRFKELTADIARVMGAESCRVAAVKGRNAVALELPNVQRRVIRFSEFLGEGIAGPFPAPGPDMSLPLIVGKDISGALITVDLAKLPHLLMAGTTGSGKSVSLNVFLASLLLTRTPEELRLILIDPKVLELSIYKGLPHLLTDVITDIDQSAAALEWAVEEMERRYKILAGAGVRHLEAYNKKADRKMPRIVIVIDEFADLMATMKKGAEKLIQRIAQKARAAGIHIILATQRPSVDVITGVIKANFPARIAFQVAASQDSRTILGLGGAETLLGMGDMLWMPPGARIIRAHAPYLSEEETEAIVDHWSSQGETDFEF